MDINAISYKSSAYQERFSPKQASKNYESLIYIMEKVFALCRFSNIDPSLYFEKGKLPTYQSCQDLLAVLREQSRPSFSLIQLVEQLEQNLTDLPFDPNSIQDFEKAYKRIQENIPLFTSNFVVHFVSQLVFHAIASLSVVNPIAPLFIFQVNDLSDAVFHYNVDYEEAVLKNQSFVEKAGVELDDLDRGFFQLFVSSIHFSLLINFKGLAFALTPLLSTPQIMEKIVQTPLFQKIKKNLQEDASEHFREKMRKKALTTLNKELGFDQIQDFLKGPLKGTDGPIVLTQRFFVDSFRDSVQKAQKVAKTTANYIRRTARNLESSSINQSDIKMKLQRELQEEWESSTSNCYQQGIATVLNYYQEWRNGISKTTFPGIQFEGLFDSYSIEWSLYQLLIPKTFLPLFLASTKSTNNELALRGAASAALFFSVEEGVSSLDMFLLSMAISSLANQFGKNYSWMNAINNEISKGSKFLRSFLDGKREILNDTLQDTLGMRSSAATHITQMLKEGMLSSPALALAAISSDTSALRWLLFFSPLNNCISREAVKWKDVNENELYAKGSILSLTQNTFLYQCLVFMILMRVSSPFLANACAIVSQFPSIKDPVSEALNEFFGPSIRRGLEKHFPAGFSWYDRAVTAQHAFSWLQWAYDHSMMVQKTQTVLKCLLDFGPMTLKRQMLKYGFDALSGMARSAFLTTGKVVAIELSQKVADSVPPSIIQPLKLVAKKSIDYGYSAVMATLLYKTLPGLIFPKVGNMLKGTLSSVLTAPPPQESSPQERKQSLLAFAVIAMLVQLASHYMFSETDESQHSVGIAQFVLTDFLTLWIFQCFKMIYMEKNTFL